MSDERVALFGGTFNPIHNGHIIVINHLVELFDKVIVMPNNISPLKVTPDVSSADRVAMVNFATRHIPKVEVSEYEVSRPDKISYTLDTIRYLKHSYPNIELVIGYDQYLTFNQWHEYQKIFDAVEINVVSRGTAIITKTADILFSFIEIPDIDISSRQIRKNIEIKKPITGMMPYLVEKYVLEKGLYIK